MMLKPNDEFMAAYERAEENELCHASSDDDEADRKRRRRTALAVGGGVAAGAAITAAVMGRRTGNAPATPTAASGEGRSPGKVYRVSTAAPGLRSGQRARYERAGLKVGTKYRKTATTSKPHPEYRYTSTKPLPSEEERAEQLAKKANYKPKIRRKK